VKVLFLFLVLASAEILRTPSSSAQVSMPGVGVISGTVFDPSGAAIPGAKVVPIGADGISVDQSLTDNAGVFRFNNAADGEYIVDEPLLQKTTAIGTSPKDLNVNLQPS
jgi:Carboxypeptidase regulatory-like domain